MTILRLLRLRNTPILEQLRIEEALLRTDTGNWLVVNTGSPQPTIVLGISGKPHELVHVERAKAEGVTLVKRFSGGGTVVVDEDTLFATLIIQNSSLPHVECYPRPIMEWTGTVYGPVFSPWGHFRLQENDYVFGERKFGGNAQAITNKRWLHHTSFLWDYKPSRMGLLRNPLRVPEYRAGRGHEEFICKMREFLPDRDTFFRLLYGSLANAGFMIEDTPFGRVEPLLNLTHLKNTRVLTDV